MLLLWFGVVFSGGATGPTEVVWFIAGNLICYFIGILLAFALKGNRAFCKYVCPVSMPLKFFSLFSLLKIKGSAALCNDCGVCVRVSPMDNRITDHIKAASACFARIAGCAKPASRPAIRTR